METGLVIFDRDATLTAFRDAVLKAIDETSKQLFNESEGWRDKDLQKLFKAIDTHVETLAKDFGVKLT